MPQCTGLAFVEIGTNRYSKFKTASISISQQPNGTTASFELTLSGGDPIPQVPAICMIKPATGDKLFGGLALQATSRFDGDIRTYSFSCVDFSYWTREIWITNYNTEIPAHLSDHVNALLTLGGVFDGDKFLQAIVNGGEPDGDDFYFNCSECTLEEALNRLMSLRGYKWWVEAGPWEDVDELAELAETGDGTEGVAILKYIPLGSTTGTAPFNITLPGDGTLCGIQKTIKNITYTAGTPAYSRVTVLGHGGDLAAGNVGPETVTDSFDLLSESQERHYQLQELCSHVLTVIMYKQARILSFTPASGAVSDEIVLTGLNFGGTSEVYFNGEAAVFTIDSETQITATVPAGATDGPITINAGVDGTATSPTDFDVT